MVIEKNFWGAAGVPDKIRIRREKGYHTDRIGKLRDGRQFMAFIVGVGRRPIRSERGSLKWYAVLHLFDAEGNHVGTKVSFLGSGAFASQLHGAEAKLTTMVRSLGPVKYSDVAVKLFSIKIKGLVFGLIDASIPSKKYRYTRVDLVPNGLAFFPPWDGTYST